MFFISKSNNFLPVLYGVIFAKQKLDDCIILNQYGELPMQLLQMFSVRKEKIIYTPPLAGGVSGVTRRFY